MSATTTALALLLLGVVPGGMYTWAFERRAGHRGNAASDRLQRLAGASAVFLALELSGIYELYRRFVATHDVSQGKPLPAWVWLLPLAMLVTPIVAGLIAGNGRYRRTEWSRFITGRAAAARGWDELFARDAIVGWVVVRLKDGSWLGGVWGDSAATRLSSYAAAYPEAQDLLISEGVALDYQGEMIRDDAGEPAMTGSAILIRWDEISYARFTRDDWRPPC